MSSCSVGTEIIKITSVLYTCALIGQYPCLDQSIQTRTFPMHQKFFLNNYCGYFIKNGFLCLDTLIVMLLDFRKAKNVSCFFTLFSILWGYRAGWNFSMRNNAIHRKLKAGRSMRWKNREQAFARSLVQS